MLYFHTKANKTMCFVFPTKSPMQEDKKHINELRLLSSRTLETKCINVPNRMIYHSGVKDKQRYEFIKVYFQINLHNYITHSGLMTDALTHLTFPSGTEDNWNLRGVSLSQHVLGYTTVSLVGEKCDRDRIFIVIDCLKAFNMIRFR